MKRAHFITLSLLLALILLFFISIVFGSVRIPLKEVINSFFNSSVVNSSKQYIIKNLRLPRALGCILGGSILALSGLVFQCVFKNPMADSYILGISSGASASVAFALLVGVKLTSTFSLPVCAVFGSILASLFVFSTNRKNYSSILLTGISVNFFLSALTTLFVNLGHGSIDSVMYWTMGSLSNMNTERVIILAFVCLFNFVFLKKKAKKLDLLLLDDSTSLSSGVDIQRERFVVLIVSSVSTAVVVSFCGVIGFIGLMSPHIGRVLIGPAHKRLIPVSMLFGANVLLFSDVLSRTIISPSELPVGIVTSILGSPLFFIMIKRKKSWLKMH